VIHVLAGPARERRAAELRELTPTAEAALTEDTIFTTEPELIDERSPNLVTSK